MRWAVAFEQWGPPLFVVASVLFALATSMHTLLTKRDVRATIGWLVVIWAVQPFGALVYLVLGVNRIRRSGQIVRVLQPGDTDTGGVTPSHVRQSFAAAGLQSLVTVMDSVSSRPMVEGNHIQVLHHGDEAYPAMLAAIDAAHKSVALSSYIFEADTVGRRFVEHLVAAQDRGVQVRVLVDAAGARYGRPRIDKVLQRAGIRCVRFMPMGRLRSWVYANLRLHRKILVCDAKVGFTGGMNIRDCHVLGDAQDSPVADTHFQIEGPVVSHLLSVFIEDWKFAAGEHLQGPLWSSEQVSVGQSVCRGLVDGPDENLDKMRWALAGALACARERVRIVTPYFLPDEKLVTLINVTALRGVQVDVVTPRRVNVRLAQWASVAQLPRILGHGCSVYWKAPPFDHSKLMIVDGRWVLFGSGNWDARSLRLNFEFNVECYDPALATQIEAEVSRAIGTAQRVDKAQLESLPLPIRLRNGLARLWLPYL